MASHDPARPGTAEHSDLVIVRAGSHGLLPAPWQHRRQAARSTNPPRTMFLEPVTARSETKHLREPGVCWYQGFRILDRLPRERT